jgi:hypothetical protein
MPGTFWSYIFVTFSKTITSSPCGAGRDVAGMAWSAAQTHGHYRLQSGEVKLGDIPQQILPSRPNPFRASANGFPERGAGSYPE